MNHDKCTACEQLSHCKHHEPMGGGVNRMILEGARRPCSADSRTCTRLIRGICLVCTLCNTEPNDSQRETGSEDDLNDDDDVCQFGSHDSPYTREPRPAISSCRGSFCAPWEISRRLQSICGWRRNAPSQQRLSTMADGTMAKY